MDFWQKTLTQARNARSELHRSPELAWREFNTAEFIRGQLTQLSIPWRPCTETGTVAVINPENGAKNIALRADIDALPIHEKTGLPHASTQSGFMHACGHDGHTATLLATAAWLKQHERELDNTITLLFQPAEEGGHGARVMIENGALEGVNEIYGWHNWPAIEFGQCFCPDGLVMCGNGVFEIQVTGVGGHASQPELCADPVLAASAIHLALQNIVSRRIAPYKTVVVAVTSIEAQSSPTVVPESALLTGSIRVPDEQTRAEVNQLIEEISRHTARAYGVQCEIVCTDRYQATINHALQAQHGRLRWQALFGEDTVLPSGAPPIMASEDFSYYLQHIPGAFALIGADDGTRSHPPCHSAYYDFNDRLIDKVARWYCSLVGAPLPEPSAAPKEVL